MKFLASTHHLAPITAFMTVSLLMVTLSTSPRLMAERHHHPSLSTPQNSSYTRKLESYAIPGITLLRMDGTRTSLHDELSREQAIMLNFIFTTCSAICPIMSGTFAEVQKRLGNDRDHLRLISISIDPENDTPDKLLDYAQRYSVDANWQFLTGNLADIIALQKAFDAYRGNKMNHVPITFLRSSGEAPWVRIEGFANADNLVEEYRRLLAP